ncbi:MAG: hypothetical protein R3C19_03580 [Planctomycetaceae bacterium]
MNHKVLLSFIAILFSSCRTVFCEDEQNAFNRKDVDFVIKFTKDKLPSVFVEPERVAAVLRSPWRLRFVESLDPKKHYFLAADFEEFKEWNNDADADDIQFEFAEKVHQRLKQRIVEATALATHWLGEPHDFTLDESVERKYAGFASTNDELAERWRKKIKLQLVMEKIAGFDPAMTREKLSARYQGACARVTDMSIEALFSRFLNTLLVQVDPNARYFGPDVLSDFRGGLARGYSIGLVTEMIEGEVCIRDVGGDARQLVDRVRLQKVIGKVLLAVRANGAEVVFTGESDFQSWRTVSGLRPDHKQFGNATAVTLELQDPRTGSRCDVEWPRYRIRW